MTYLRSQSRIGPFFRSSSRWSETSQPSMTTDSKALGSGDWMATHNPHGKRKNAHYDAESELDRLDSGGSSTALHSVAAPSVVAVPRAPASNHQRQRQRQRPQDHSSEDFAPKEPEGAPHVQQQRNSEGATSSTCQDAPSAAPAANPGGSSCPTCWLCRGPATSGRVVELVAIDRGPALSPNRAWIPGPPSDFGTNVQENSSYRLQPVGQLAAWESTDMNSTQSQAPRFPAGWANNGHGEVPMTWSVDTYDGFANASSYAGFPGSSVPFPPSPGSLGPHAQGERGNGCLPVVGQDSALLTLFDGGFTGGDDGPVNPFSSGMNSESPDAHQMSGNKVINSGKYPWHGL